MGRLRTRNCRVRVKSFFFPEQIVDRKSSQVLADRGVPYWGGAYDHALYPPRPLPPIGRGDLRGGFRNGRSFGRGQTVNLDQHRRRRRDPDDGWCTGSRDAVRFTGREYVIRVHV